MIAEELTTKRVAELAWSAGLVDGEGSICIVKSRESYRLTLAICMTHESTIKRISNIFGNVGSISLMSKTGKDKDAWTWHTAGGQAAKIIQDMYPYLHTKKAQAELAIEYGLKCLWKRQVGEYVPIEIEGLRAVFALEMAALNKRGKS